MKNFFTVILFSFLILLPGLVKADMSSVDFTSLKCDSGDTWISGNLEECEKLGASSHTSENFGGNNDVYSDIYFVYNEDNVAVKSTSSDKAVRYYDKVPGNKIGCCRSNIKPCDENSYQVRGDAHGNCFKNDYKTKDGYCCSKKILGKDGTTSVNYYSPENLKYYLEFIGIGVVGLILFSVLVLFKIRSKNKSA